MESNRMASPASPLVTPRIGIYSRISEDIEGEGLGVERQRRDATALAERRGWTVADYYIDNNFSAYKRGLVRPEFERLLVDLADGKLDGLVAYDLDRIARQPKQLEQILDIYEDKKTLVFATVQADLDLSTSDGRTMARVMVAFANKSSADTSRRVKRKNLERAEMGLPHGPARPFGYEDDKITIRPIEAELLRSCAHKLLSGWTYRDIAVWLNEQESRGTKGGQWRYPYLMRILRSKRYIGICIHDGVEYPGAQQPIFDLDTWTRIQHEMDERSRPQQIKARKYLLTGLVRCGICGGFMAGDYRSPKSNPGRSEHTRHTYRCKRQDTSGNQIGCGRVSRAAMPIEHLIREAVIYRLDTAELAKLLEAQAAQHSQLTPLLNKRAALQARLEARFLDYDDGTLTKAEYMRAKSRTLSALEAVQREIDRNSTSTALHGLGGAGDTLRERWMAETDGWRRKVMGMLIKEIVVLPSRSRGVIYDCDGVPVIFDKAAIKIVWRA